MEENTQELTNEERWKRYESFNHKIEHEDNLFNLRITWFVSLQTLLFIPTFSILSAAEETILNENQDGIILRIILIGLLLCFVVLLSCLAAQYRIYSLITKHDEANDHHEIIHPQMTSPRLAHILGIVTPYASIIIFTLFWASLGAIKIPVGETTNSYTTLFENSNYILQKIFFILPFTTCYISLIGLIATLIYFPEQCSWWKHKKHPKIISIILLILIYLIVLLQRFFIA